MKDKASARLTALLIVVYFVVIFFPSVLFGIAVLITHGNAVTWWYGTRWHELVGQSPLSGLAIFLVPALGALSFMAFARFRRSNDAVEQIVWLVFGLVLIPIVSLLLVECTSTAMAVFAWLTCPDAGKC